MFSHDSLPLQFQLNVIDEGPTYLRNTYETGYGINSDNQFPPPKPHERSNSRPFDLKINALTTR